MKLNLEYLWMPDAYEQLNRLRGTDSMFKPWWLPAKLFAYLYMSLMFCVYMLTSLTFSWALLVGDYIGNYIIFQVVGWGKYWPHEHNTSHEKEFFLADWWANWRIGKYDENSTSDFGKNWKTSALKFRFGFLVTIKFTILGIILSDPITPIVGLLFGHKMGDMYRDAFDEHKSDYAIHAAEFKTGKFFGQLMLVPVAVAIGKAVWMTTT